MTVLAIRLMNLFDRAFPRLFLNDTLEGCPWRNLR